MKIAFDAILTGKNSTGVGNYIECLLDSLDRVNASQNHSIEAFYPAHMPTRSRWTTIKLRRVYGVGRFRPLRIWWEQVLFPAFLRRRYDLLHMPAYVAPLVVNVPTVVTVHDVIALRYPELCSVMNALHFRALMPVSIRKAMHVIVPTNSVRAALLRLCPSAADKISVIHEGVREVFRTRPDRATQEGTKRRLGITGRMLLFVGNLEPKKNLPILLAAFERAKDQFPDLNLVLCGRMGWKARPIRQALRKLSFRKDVIVTGYVPTSVLHSLYAIAEALVFPSIIEGFGIPPLEAMACGTPVIASDAEAITEIAGEGALRVNATCAPALADAIASVLESADLRDELRGRGFERSRCFSWERAAKETLAVYQHVCQQA